MEVFPSTLCLNLTLLQFLSIFSSSGPWQKDSIIDMFQISSHPTPGSSHSHSDGLSARSGNVSDRFAHVTRTQVLRGLVLSPSEDSGGAIPSLFSPFGVTNPSMFDLEIRTPLCWWLWLGIHPGGARDRNIMCPTCCIVLVGLPAAVSLIRTSYG